MVGGTAGEGYGLWFRTALIIPFCSSQRTCVAAEESAAISAEAETAAKEVCGEGEENVEICAVIMFSGTAAAAAEEEEVCYEDEDAGEC